jgi:transcriptional regulator with XRE-family HTH domain
MRTEKEETFIERFERLCNSKGILKSEIAHSCGISQNGISTWKVTGTIPRADVAVRLADCLGVTVEYLITGKMKNIDDMLEYRIAALPEKKRRLIRALVDELDDF